MPVLNYMDFAKHNLRLSYRASGEPQILTIDVATAELARIQRFNGLLATLRMLVKFGGCGSDVFPPWAGSMERGLEPQQEEERGPTYHAEVPVAGVAPVAMRIFVEQLRASGFHQPVDAMAIRGALPVNDSPLSITEVDMKRWIEDEVTYPKAWPHIDFPLVIKPAASGFSMHLRFAGAIPKEHQDWAEALSSGWALIVSHYPLADGTGSLQFGPGSHAGDHFPRTKVGERDVWVKMKKMPWVRQPSLDLLTNMLIRFHHDAVPIEKAEISC